MSELLSIGGVCRLLGISLSTAYRRIKAGTIVPAFRTSGGHRRFERRTVVPGMKQGDAPLRIVTYARVSSVDQKNDLEVQSEKSSVMWEKDMQVAPTCISHTLGLG